MPSQYQAIKSYNNLNIVLIYYAYSDTEPAAVFHEIHHIFLQACLLRIGTFYYSSFAEDPFNRLSVIINGIHNIKQCGKLQYIARAFHKQPIITIQQPAFTKEIFKIII